MARPAVRDEPSVPVGTRLEPDTLEKLDSTLRPGETRAARLRELVERDIADKKMPATSRQ
ncbi:MAG: hypothetical protein ACRCXB_14020 [Aeromonadaceae bacterium]